MCRWTEQIVNSSRIVWQGRAFDTGHDVAIPLLVRDAATEEALFLLLSDMILPSWAPTNSEAKMAVMSQEGRRAASALFVRQNLSTAEGLREFADNVHSQMGELTAIAQRFYSKSALSKHARHIELATTLQMTYRKQKRALDGGGGGGDECGSPARDSRRRRTTAAAAEEPQCSVDCTPASAEPFKNGWYGVRVASSGVVEIKKCGVTECYKRKLGINDADAVLFQPKPLAVAEDDVKALLLLVDILTHVACVDNFNDYTNFSAAA